MPKLCDSSAETAHRFSVAYNKDELLETAKTLGNDAVLRQLVGSLEDDFRRILGMDSA